MKSLLAIILLFVLGQDLMAQHRQAFGAANTLRSVSGQFIIHDERDMSPPRKIPTANDQQLLELQPSFLTVSCERIKQAIYSELGASRDWSGKIHATIRPVNRISINAERFSDVWNYKLDLPQRVERVEFVRTIVLVVLQEMANRNATDHSAEIPIWLTEGLTQRLLASREAELILPPPTMNVGLLTIAPTMLVTKDPDPLQAARRVLKVCSPPTLEELTWPSTAQLANGGAIFSYSSQLFVSELLQLKEGKDSLRATVLGLGNCYNWQTAFLREFKSHFANQLALEKWWALQIAYFVGRDHKSLWTPEETVQKLNEILHVTLAVRSNVNDLPSRAGATLQTIIREWDSPSQMGMLRAKLRDLEMAQVRVSPDFIALVNEYRGVITVYLQKRERSATTFGDIRSMPPSIKQIVREVVRQLDDLDVRRAALEEKSRTNPDATTSEKVALIQ